MRTRIFFLLVVATLFGAWLAWHGAQTRTPAALPASTTMPRADAPAPADARSAQPSDLPREAIQTLRLIHSGGALPHRQDGAVFQNREHRLPPRARGYYREYTVATPHARDRGARRIVTGGDPPAEFYYSGDHYRSFRRIDPQAGYFNE